MAFVTKVVELFKFSSLKMVFCG